MKPEGRLAVLGETDKAMAWLESSVNTGFACWPFFQVDPHLESLRERPNSNDWSVILSKNTQPYKSRGYSGC